MIAILSALLMSAAANGTPELTGAMIDVVDEVLREESTPAAAIVLVTDEGPILFEVGGVKQLGGSVAATAEDPWHIGSNAKAMTATLAMALVEDGLIDLDTTVPDALGDEYDIDDAWSDVTLRMLLTHRSGLQANMGPLSLLRYQLFGSSDVGGPSRDRRSLFRSILKKPPEGSPGEAFVYSNLGYTLAGMMLEGVSGKTFETLIRERLFAPLGMEGAIVGAPVGDGEAVLRGHRGDPLSMAPPGADNPAVMSPAGTFAFPLDAYARFLKDQLDGHLRKDALLAPESYEAIRTPMAEDQDYALGWGVTDEGWLRHSGSNTMWFVTTIVAPDRGVAISILTNSGEVSGLGERIETLIDAHFPGMPGDETPMP